MLNFDYGEKEEASSTRLLQIASQSIYKNNEIIVDSQTRLLPILTSTGCLWDRSATDHNPNQILLLLLFFVYWNLRVQSFG